MRAGCFLLALAPFLFLALFGGVGSRVDTIAPPAPPTTVTNEPCAFSWATRPLPELAAQLNQALADGGLSSVTASVSAFGENCIVSNGTVRGFLMFEVTYTFSLPLTPAGSADGDLARQALAIWQPIATPSPAPNERIELRFEGGDQIILVETTGDQAREALSRMQSATGDQFIDALLMSP